ncbi:D-alanine--D-alanine ligase [Agarivorans sp. MS3-6]
MKIEIVTAVSPALKETGFGSALACNDVFASLTLQGHVVRLSECGSLKDLDAVTHREPDLVVLAAKYMPMEGGDKLWFSDYFAQHNITFSGSTRETLNYDSDKVLAKSRLSSLGIKTARYFTATPGEFSGEEELPLSFPLFLKPTDAANGNGIDDQSFVENFSQFQSKVCALYAVYKQPILVEEFLAGKEFTVAVINSTDGTLSISAIELEPPLSSGNLRILGAVVKIQDTETLKKVNAEQLEEVQLLAAHCYRALGVRGYGRIDVKMDLKGVCYFMEANLVPGMKRASSYFPKACEITNQLSYDEVIKLMFNESFMRVLAKQSLDTMFEPAPLSCAV